MRRLLAMSTLVGMARMNVERGVERLARQAEKLTAAAGKLLGAARKGDHSALAEKLEKMHAELGEHVKGLEAHRVREEPEQKPPAQADVTVEAQGTDIPVETNVDEASPDPVEEAAKESFPASDPPAHY